MPERLVVALSRTVADHAPEVKYVLRTLLRTAGFGERFVWADRPGGPVDILYGADEVSAPLVIVPRADSPWMPTQDPVALHERGGLPFVCFDGDVPDVVRDADATRLTQDVVRSSFWVLAGLGERRIPRDRRDNFNLSQAFVWTSGLMQRPVVSEYGAWLREFFTARGRVARPLPWVSSASRAAFAFSHDVDYPEMVRSIECLRLLRGRGLSAWQSIVGVMMGRNHFWKFGEWVEWQKSLGTRPAFYFSAVRGSLARYALGIPDCLYDVRSRRFRDLFRQLRDEGCEIGLHASYQSHRSPGSIAVERLALREVSGAECEGLRHHYWRLNPEDPHETLEFHERAGFAYDASLGFEFGPGFRRGICHPFRAYSVPERRALGVLQLPTAWMDDHFDRRLSWNAIVSPNESARGLVEASRATGGLVLVDYHARGMNADFYPRYGPWLMRFVADTCGSETRFTRAGDVARDYRTYEAALDAISDDHTIARPAVTVHAAPSSTPRIGVLTTNRSAYGRALLHALAARGVPVRLVLVVDRSIRSDVRDIRRLARRVGWAGALGVARAEIGAPLGPTRSTIAGPPLGGLASEVRRVGSLRSAMVRGLLQRAEIDLLLLGQTGIVPGEVLSVPSLGSLNAHPGSLPRYRGMDCAAWALLQGDRDAVGSTLHWVTEQVDAGPLVQWRPYRFRGDETLRLLEERLYDDCIRLLAEAAATVVQGGTLPAEPNAGGTLYHKMPIPQRREAERRLRAASSAASAVEFARPAAERSTGMGGRS